MNLARPDVGHLPSVAALLLWAMSSSVVSASSFYIAPEAYLTYPDETFRDEDYSLGISFGGQLFKNWDVELGYSVNRFISEENPALFEQRNLQINTLWTLGQIDAIKPYASLGYGAGQLRYADEKEVRQFISVGVGYTFELPVLSGLFLQNELRGRLYIGDDPFNESAQSTDTQIMLRLKYQPGATQKIEDTARTTEPQELPKAWSELPAGTVPATSLSQTCAQESPGSQRYTELRCTKLVDHDQDSIEDALDRCPNTVPGVRVDTDGCTIGR